MDLSLLFLRMGLHAVYEDEPPEFAPKMLSKLSFMIANQASIILDREKGRKWRGKHKKRPQITEMPIRTRLILSHDLCVCAGSCIMAFTETWLTPVDPETDFTLSGFGAPMR